MKALIIGSGGREHAIAWKIAQSSQVDTVFVAPGNPGTDIEPKCENVSIAATDIDKLVAFANKHRVDLTIVGPEAPLAAGITDAFIASGLKCFGPTKAAAQLEASKEFCKDFLKAHHIPTAAYAAFTDEPSAIDYLKTQTYPIVIKADGLAAGKGVIIADTKQHAIDTIHDMLANNQFGDAGHRIVIESFLKGEEISFIAICDGEHAMPLASSQDHKRRDDGDLGPNTGGMGAYSPAPRATTALCQTIMDTVIQPTLKGMANKGMPYTGFLYAGIMISDDNIPNVLEFNCRLGDPETQALLPRLQSDLFQHCMDAVDEKLAGQSTQWDPRPALTVVHAASGYPESPRRGDEITGLDTPLPSDTKIFYAGVSEKDGLLHTAGGRVIAVTAIATTLQAAQTCAYTASSQITWPGQFYRTDIGYRALS